MSGLAVGPALGRYAGLTLGWEIGACRGPGDAQAVAACGGAYVEVGCRGELVPDQPREAFEERLAKLRSLPIPASRANTFLPSSLPCVGPEADHDRVLAFAEVAFERAREANIGLITFGSGGARRVPDGYDKADAELQFVALLARMAPIAKHHDVVVSVESLNKGEVNFINRVSEAHRLVRAVNHPNIGLTADFYHMLREDEGPESIVEAGQFVRHVHIAERAHRTPPGHEGDDFTGYFEALRSIGYTGKVSIECRWDDLDRQLPKAIATIRKQSGEG